MPNSLLKTLFLALCSSVVWRTDPILYLLFHLTRVLVRTAPWNFFFSCQESNWLWCRNWFAASNNRPRVLSLICWSSCFGGRLVSCSWVVWSSMLPSFWISMLLPLWLYGFHWSLPVLGFHWSLPCITALLIIMFLIFWPSCLCPFCQDRASNFCNGFFYHFLASIMFYFALWPPLLFTAYKSFLPFSNTTAFTDFCIYVHDHWNVWQQIFSFCRDEYLIPRGTTSIVFLFSHHKELHLVFVTNKGTLHQAK